MNGPDDPILAWRVLPPCGVRVGGRVATVAMAPSCAVPGVRARVLRLAGTGNEREEMAHAADWISATIFYWIADCDRRDPSGGRGGAHGSGGVEWLTRGAPACSTIVCHRNLIAREESCNGESWESGPMVKHNPSVLFSFRTEKIGSPLLQTLLTTLSVP